MPPAAPRTTSATRTTGTPAGYKPGGGGTKILGLKPKTALIAGGGVLAAALVYFWWRGRQAKPTSASTSTTASAGTYAGEFERYVYGTSTSTGTGSGGGGGGTGSTGTGTKKSTSTGTTTKKSTSTATKTTPPPTTKPKVTAPKMPVGVRATKTTSNAVTLTWAKDATATSYRIRVTYQGKEVSQSTVTSNTATISGLGADHTYTFHVAGVNAGGISPETNGPAVKTTR
jgi:hypothetical protein